MYIEELLVKCNKTLNDLDAISVSIGPGSYTGLRIGLAVGKGLCFGLKIPLLTVKTLDSLLETGRKKHPQQTLCACIDARRMEVYSKVKSAEGECYYESNAIVIDKNSFIEFEPFVYFGDGSAKLKEAWKDRPLKLDEDIHLSAEGQISLAVSMLRNKDFDDLAYIKPLYIKEFRIG